VKVVVAVLDGVKVFVGVFVDVLEGV
jgi:hypothetical protein